MRIAGPICIATLVLVAVPAGADPRNDVLSTAARCNAITDYRVWLDCYYGAAQSMREILGLSPAPPSQVKLVPPAGPQPVPMPPAASTAATAGPPASDEVYVPRQHMTDYSFDKHNRFTVTMEDGTVWQQIQEDSVTARWRGQPASYSASVVPAMFGTMLRVSDGHSYRVRKAR